MILSTPPTGDTWEILLDLNSFQNLMYRTFILLKKNDVFLYVVT